ncbi:alpha/beta hydrolase [Chryseobacterium sp. LC2016-29]|uniref:alpha/beta fold hydrolase n=1 Tax=Chryseobacterium sp. LC2016-29 TaxID=2897331 RepID=UPI001E4D3349|nr:alpha/beta hydrolase [Chryseobacterium sp. LC2016-29]MCD0477434.1 alpha/beta hydrolase [Chryseobacterium sp. LC2016-29]
MNFKYNALLAFNTLCITFTHAQQLKNGNFTEKIDSISINYTIKGNGPAMFVGHPNSGKIGYELTLQPLEKQFTMVYYDSRGTGKSAAPKKIEDYSLEKSVVEIEELRKKLNIDKIWFFAHSDQSGIAMLYSLEHPNHVEGMILTGTSLVASPEEVYNRKKESENKRIKESEWFSQVVKDWDYMYTNKTEKAPDGRDLSEAPLKWWCYDEESSKKVIPIMKEISKAGRRKPVNGQIPQAEKMIEYYYNQQKKFSQIKTKSLILNGKADTNNLPEFAEQLHKTLPNSKLVFIEKAGHFPWVEDAVQSFTEIEKWLEEIKF